jgi:CheY-like chemotaxis protein
MTVFLGQTPSVFVTDDTAAVRDVVSRVLAADGYLVETAAQGAQALDKIGRHCLTCTCWISPCQS